MTVAHDFPVDLRKRFLNSLFWAVGNLILAAATFASFFSRFSGQGIILLRPIFTTFVVTCVLFIPDLCRSKTRLRGGAALLLCLPIFVFFGLLTVWEGPLYVSVTGSEGPLRFNVAGPAGLYGMSVYSSEHRKAEWRGDAVGLLWSFSWPKHSFPSMQTEFAYGTSPAGYLQKNAIGSACS